ncbi:DinB family protein [Ramlibacter sp. AN1133]|uniref:DinB family protein n=1 Tax=Ramlibacter sp. AN1133 TaxID=3133429 RepID=UPI0030C11B23
MSAATQIRRLTRYSAWANARLFQAVSELPEGVATAARPTLFGNMVHTLNHAYVVDQIWQAHLEGRPHGFTALNTKEPTPLAQLRQAQALMDQWYVAYADALPEDAHAEVVAFRFVDGGPGAMSRADILLHVVNHKTYHRGWVADLFFQAGARPPSMDLPVYLRQAG